MVQDPVLDDYIRWLGELGSVDENKVIIIDTTVIQMHPRFIQLFNGIGINRFITILRSYSFKTKKSAQHPAGRQFEYLNFRGNRGAIRKKTKSTSTNAAAAAFAESAAATTVAELVGTASAAFDAAAASTAAATAAELVVRELQSLKHSISEAAAASTAAELQSLKQSLSEAATATEFQSLKESISDLSDRMPGGGSL